jgi:hypothetical protein
MIDLQFAGPATMVASSTARWPPDRSICQPGREREEGHYHLNLNGGSSTSPPGRCASTARTTKHDDLRLVYLTMELALMLAAQGRQCEGVGAKARPLGFLPFPHLKGADPRTAQVANR